jgi:hypothetical protein
VTLYRVTWEIDVEADSPYEAAREAFAMQHDTLADESIATCFDVRENVNGELGEPVCVDLLEEP